MPENVQPINYFIKWSRISFNIAHVKHYVLLFMIWDFDLEFSMFLTFSFFSELSNSFPLKRLIVLRFHNILVNLKFEYKASSPFC